jgi:hypothetical protein
MYIDSVDFVDFDKLFDSLNETNTFRYDTITDINNPLI